MRCGVTDDLSAPTEVLESPQRVNGTYLLLLVCSIVTEIVHDAFFANVGAVCRCLLENQNT